jgi:hypothetical protein
MLLTLVTPATLPQHRTIFLHRRLVRSNAEDADSRARSVEGHREACRLQSLRVDVPHDRVGGGVIGGLDLGFIGRRGGLILHRSLRLADAEQLLSRVLHEIEHSHGCCSLVGDSANR